MKYLSKVICQVLVVFCVVSTGIRVQAAETTLAEDVYQLQLKAFQASTSFHMYTLLEGDPQVGEDISNVVLQIQQLVNALQADELLSNTETLGETSERFTQLVQSNEIAEEGFTSVYTINDMEDSLTVFLADLNSLQSVTEQISLQKEIFESAVLIRKIGSRYARLAAHWNARAGILADIEGDTIDVHARAVTEQLNNIMNRGDLSDEVKTSVSQVVKKWRFISPKLLDYQNDTVPYLVTRYSTSIVNQLVGSLEHSIE